VEGVLLRRISGGYSQEIMGLVVEESPRGVQNNSETKNYSSFIIFFFPISLSDAHKTNQ